MTLLLMWTACMPASHRQAKRLEGRYDVPPPGKGWHLVEPGGADHAWFNKELGAVIYTDSNCGPRFDELAAEDLATELVAGLREEERIRDETIALAGREGVLRVHRGKLDGVPMQLGFVVINRDACTYDFTYLASPDTFDAGFEAWEKVWRGFRPR
ncbi:MAG: hypothetical protein ACOZNI_35125 [Myxococcota bacterium]